MAYFQNDIPISKQPLIFALPGEEHSSASRQIAGSAGNSGEVGLLELGSWDNPHRNTWVNKLNLAILRADRPVVLVADGLACLAVIWWAEYERPAYGHPVVGALLISPPDLDRPGSDPRLARFGSCPSQPLPFPSLLVAKGNEPHDLLRTWRRIAAEWDSRFVEARSVDDPTASASSPLAGRLVTRLLRDCQMLAVRLSET